MFLTLGLMIALTPYRDAHPAAYKPAAEVAIALRGRPNEAVRLHVSGLPAGWIASFCSAKICSLSRIGLTLPPSGVESLQVKLIRNEPHAGTPQSIVLLGSDRARATIPFAAAVLK